MPLHLKPGPEKCGGVQILVETTRDAAQCSPPTPALRQTWFSPPTVITRTWKGHLLSGPDFAPSFHACCQTSLTLRILQRGKETGQHSVDSFSSSRAQFCPLLCLFGIGCYAFCSIGLIHSPRRSSFPYKSDGEGLCPRVDCIEKEQQARKA